HHVYADMVDNPVVAGLYAANSESLGRPLAASSGALGGSTDMGNISYLVPSIHPIIKVAPAGVSIHSHEFTRHAASPAGDEAVVLGAKAMAMTIADLWAESSFIEDAKAAFQA